MNIVFYDGKCGLCRREIQHYIRIAPVGVFEWVDITIDSTRLEEMGISYVDGLRLLHATDQNGKIYTGIDAFILIWQHIPYWRLLAKIMVLPLVHKLVEKLYNLFATWRFNRLSHCKIATENNKSL